MAEQCATERTASDYDHIREENRVRYGEETEWRHQLLADLYSKHSHFIFELIQNAEDAGATRMHFSLESDRLVVVHDGRAFTGDDVRAICAIAKSAKPDSPGQIGRFGIGFKSVYAYTERPQVHCPPEHFCIEEFFWPRAVAAVAPGAGWSTRFDFPFDRVEPSVSRSIDEIASALRALSPRTLLFLTHLKELTWRVNGGERALRANSTEGTFRFVMLSDAESSESWVVFRGAVSVDNAKTLPAELAFLIALQPDGSRRVRPAEHTELVAFFPTTRETHLGFLLQAPFVLTTSRENVHEDSNVNRQLVNRASTLLAESLERLRDEDLLDAVSLGVLPLATKYFATGTFLRPLYDTVRVALRDRPLLPKHGGGWAAARSLKAARTQKLRELVEPEQLTELLRARELVSWVSGAIAKDSTPTLHRYLVGHTPRFVGDPQIEPLVPDFEVRVEILLRALAPDFLAKQSDEWMCRLYALLATQRAEIDGLRSMAIIRTEAGVHVSVLDERDQPAVWLPPTTLTEFTIVKRSIAADPAAKNFMTSLGLTLPDEADDLMKALKQYDSSQRPDPNAHADLLRRLEETLATAAPQKRQRLIETAKRLHMVRARNAGTGAESWKRPVDTYLVEEAGFQAFLEGDEGTWVLGESGQPPSFWEKLGVHTSPVIHYRRPLRDGFVPILNSWGCHQRGVHGFDPDFDIDGLGHALRTHSIPKAHFLWSFLSNYAKTVYGTVQQSSRQDYSNVTSEERASKAGELLRSGKWLPDRAGEFRRPAELSLAELPDDFDRDEELARALGMVAAGLRNDIARALGIDEAQIAILLTNRSQFAEFIETLSARERRQPAASSATKPPEGHIAGRQHGGGEDVDIDDELPEGGPRTAASVAAAAQRASQIPKRVRTEIRNRFATVLSGEAAAERENAVLEVMADYAGRCQICSRTFIQRDGTHGCQILQLQPTVSAGGLTTAGNLVLVCGWHAALLREGRYTFFGNEPIDPNALRSRILDARDRDIEIVFHQILVGGRMTSSIDEVIRYSGPHWQHLQAFFRAGAT